MGPAPRRFPPGVTPFGRACREPLKEAAKTLKRPSNPLDFFQAAFTRRLLRLLARPGSPLRVHEIMINII